MFRSDLTHEEVVAGTRALQPSIERYAELIVRKGVAVQPGQEVVVSAPVDTAPFARLLVRKAYAAGAGHVTMIWSDDEVTRATYENVPVEWFRETPSWQRLMYDSLAEQGACFVFVEGADPEALKGIDPAKPMAAATARNSQCRVFRHGLDFNINPWCIAGAPVAAWARTVFPGLSDEAACYRLWQAILDASRALGDDPCADWELHNATFEKNLRMLNEAHFDRRRSRS